MAPKYKTKDKGWHIQTLYFFHENIFEVEEKDRLNLVSFISGKLELPRINYTKEHKF